MRLAQNLFQKKREFYPKDLKINRWRTVKREFALLLNMQVSSVSDLELLIKKSGEGLKILFDYRNKLFISFKTRSTFFHFLKYVLFQRRIIGKGIGFNHQWECKIANSPFSSMLNPERYGHFLKLLKHQQQIFTPKNAKLLAQEEQLANRYPMIRNRLRATFQGKNVSLDELDKELLDKKREERKKAFLLINQSYQKSEKQFLYLFEKLLTLRHTVGMNAGFRNFRDYAHHAKARFSYSIADLMNFHQVVEQEVVPTLQEINANTLNTHHLKEMRPWDTRIDCCIDPPPYSNENDLLEKCALTLSEIKPLYGDHFRKMCHSGFIDLFSRPKKSSGAYNVPFYETGASFIIANFIKKHPTHHDVAILHHEFGHSLHHFFTTDEPILSYRNFPSEISELAAITMELISADHLHHFYPDQHLIRQARQYQIKRLIHLIVSRCQGDAFQHWVYTHPGHQVEERNQAYIQCSTRFNDGVSWKGLEELQHLEQHKVLHFFQVPFYYIEYAFAALGALEIYRNYQKNKVDTLDQFESFLRAGHSQDVDQLYHKAGASFCFSPEKVRGLMQFAKKVIKL